MVPVAGQRLSQLEWWFRQNRERTGLWPIVIGDFDDVVMEFEEPDEGTVEEIYQEALAVSLEDLLAEYRERAEDALAVERDPEWLRHHNPRFGLGPDDDGFWAGEPGRYQNLGASPIGYSEDPDQVLALFEVDRGSDVLAEVGWHAIGSSASVAEHVRLLRHLQDRYRIVLVGLSSTSLDLMMEQPIGSPDEAVDLATTIYEYASSLGIDSSESLGAVASCLREGGFLRPWWD